MGVRVETYDNWWSFLDKMKGERSNRQAVLAAKGNPPLGNITLGDGSPKKNMERSFVVEGCCLDLFTGLDPVADSVSVVFRSDNRFSATKSIPVTEYEAMSLKDLLVFAGILPSKVHIGLEKNEARLMDTADKTWEEIQEMTWRVNGQSDLLHTWEDLNAENQMIKGKAWRVIDKFRHNGVEIRLCISIDDILDSSEGDDWVTTEVVNFIFIDSTIGQTSFSSSMRIAKFSITPLPDLLSITGIPWAKASDLLPADQSLLDESDDQPPRLWF